MNDKHLLYLSDDGDWSVVIRQCPRCECWSPRTGRAVVLEYQGVSRACWHLSPLFGRRHTSHEAVIKALTRMQEIKLRTAQEATEAEHLRQFAKEVVQDHILEAV